MNIGARYFLLVLAVVICLHYLLSFTHEEYGKITSIENIKSHFIPSFSSSNTTSKPNANIPVQDDITNPPPSNPNPPPSHEPPKNDDITQSKRANATLVMLARNSDTDNVVRTIRDIEDRFNKQFRYPYVILTEPGTGFDGDFKRRVSIVTRSTVEFDTVPRDMWDQPTWIDKAKAQETRERMEKDNIVFGGSVYHRNLWRFRAGFFFKHRLLDKYRWYWWIDPGTRYHCNMDDPFLFMQQNNKTFGFTMTLYEFQATIESLWGHVKDFTKLYPEYVAQNNAIGYLSDDGGESYNRCHFWSNFQIADMDFWRGDAYQAFFNYLDSKGGFYYERWAEAPIHSMAVSLFAQKHQIHFFDEIGYENNPYVHCTQREELWKREKCGCDPKRNFDYDGYSCMKQWERIHD